MSLDSERPRLHTQGHLHAEVSFWQEEEKGVLFVSDWKRGSTEMLFSLEHGVKCEAAPLTAGNRSCRSEQRSFQNTESDGYLSLAVKTTSPTLKAQDMVNLLKDGTPNKVLPFLWRSVSV